MAFVRPRRRREFHQRYNPINAFSEHHFLARYRLPKDTVRQLAANYGNSQYCSTNGDPRGGGISPEERFCVALRFLATGCNYAVVADYQGLHKSTLCRCLKEVTQYLASLADESIRFPRTPQEQAINAQAFYQKTGKPSIIGAVDGTHVPIMRPRGEEDFPFINRKLYHSLNVMLICDASLKIIHMDARFPGRTHDSFVLRANGLHDFAEGGGMRGYFLLGDSGYALKPWLLTPFGRPATPQQINYNRWHTSTRSSVERAIGRLKQRWRAIDDSAGYLMSPPTTCARIVMACCVLHNLAIDGGVSIVMDDDIDGRPFHIRRRRAAYAGEPLFEDPPAGGALDRTGIQVRYQFLNLFRNVVRPIQHDNERGHGRLQPNGLQHLANEE